jgi:RNase_H superfamily
MKQMAFDLEIAKLLPQDAQDLLAHRPLGISCAATLASDQGEPRLWSSRGEAGYLPQMTVADVQSLVQYLSTAVADGYTLFTWNGLGFDLNILAEESQTMGTQCRDLALQHIDMFFHLFCLLGYGLGLDVVAKGLRLPGKQAGMNGSLAPQVWRSGQYEQVLSYVAQDVRTVMDIAQRVDAVRQVQWTARSGRVNRVPIRRWLTVQEAMRLPEPDTSWMRNPWPRSKFTGWLET